MTFLGLTLWKLLENRNQRGLDLTWKSFYNMDEVPPILAAFVRDGSIFFAVYVDFIRYFLPTVLIANHRASGEFPLTPRGAGGIDGITCQSRQHYWDACSVRGCRSGTNIVFPVRTFCCILAFTILKHPLHWQMGCCGLFLRGMSNVIMPSQYLVSLGLTPRSGSSGCCSKRKPGGFSILGSNNDISLQYTEFSA